MIVYLIWLCVCLGLVIIGLMIDRSFLNQKISDQNDDLNYHREDQRKYINRNVSLRTENDELNDLLDQYILRDFERVEKKVIVKNKKK